MPTADSIQFLFTYIQHCRLQENHKSGFFANLTSNPGEKSNDQYPLRKQLIDWLLLDKEKDCEHNPSKFVENNFPELKGRLLALLCMKSPWKFSETLNEKADENKNVHTDLEKLYSGKFLEFTDDAELNMKRDVASDKVQTTHLPVLLHYMEEQVSVRWIV